MMRLPIRSSAGGGLTARHSGDENRDDGEKERGRGGGREGGRGGREALGKSKSEASQYIPASKSCYSDYCT